MVSFEDAMAQVLALGLPLIAGASDDPPADPPLDPPADPPTDPPADPPPPTIEERLVQERERAARLEGELAALRAQPKPPAAPNKDRTLDELTAEELDVTASKIEQQIDAGEITAGRGARILGQIEAARGARLREARETRERPLRTAEGKLAEQIRKHPELRQAGSDLLTKVTAELPAVEEEFGFGPDDPRAQLIAVERIVGRLGGGSGMDGREFARRNAPTGGVGTGPAGGGDRRVTTDPVAEVEKLYPDQARYWDRLGYSADERKREAPLVLARRGRRVARTA